MPRSRFRPARRIAVAVAAVAALFTLSIGGAAVATPAGEISGIVTSSAGGPISGVVITASLLGGPIGPPAIATSQSDGSFDLTGLGFGDYYVSVNSQGRYQDLSASITPTLTSLVPAVTEDISLDPWPTGTSSISGVVTDKSTSAPVSGMSVNVQDTQTFRNFFLTTDSDGRYSVDSLPSSSYTVGLSSGSYVTPQLATQVNVFTGQAATRNFQLVPADSTISGHITDTTSTPLGFMNVSVVLNSDSSITNSAFIDPSSGDFSVNVGSGTYTLTLGGSGTPFTAQTSQVTTSPSHAGVADFTLAERVTGSISGTVSDTSGPVEGICVQADSSDGSYGGNGQTLSDGTYDILGLDPGTYTLEFWDCDGGLHSPSYAITWFGGTTNQHDSTTVAVTAATETAHQDLLIAPGGSISGHVNIGTSTGTVEFHQGHAFGPTLFHLVDGSWEVEDNPSSFVGNSTVIGDYTLDGLPAGTYRVGFLDSRTGPLAYAPVFWGGSSTVATATGVTVTAGTTVSGIDGTVSVPEPTSSATPADSSDLDSSTQNGVNAPSSAQQGDTVTVDVGDFYDGQWISVWGHSTPVQMGSWHQVGANGTVTVTVPTALEAGAHKLEAQLADGTLVGWVPIAVSAAPASPTTGSGSGSAASPAKSRTQAEFGSPASSETTTPAVSASPTPTPTVAESTPPPTGHKTPHAASAESNNPAGTLLWIALALVVLVAAAITATVLVRRRALR